MEHNHTNNCSTRKLRVDRLMIVILTPIILITTLIATYYHFKAIELTDEAIIVFDKPIEEAIVSEEYTIVDFAKISFYCDCGKCNGYNEDGTPRSVNAYDEKLEWGMCASNYFPQGYEFYLFIDGYYQKFVVCDYMASRFDEVKIIDIYVPETHEECQKRGVINNMALYEKIN